MCRVSKFYTTVLKQSSTIKMISVVKIFGKLGVRSGLLTESFERTSLFEVKTIKIIYLGNAQSMVYFIP